MRLIASSNLVIYNSTTSIPIAAIPIIKTHWNSVISTLNTKYLALNIKDFYLNSKLEEFEYMRLLYHLFPKELIELHDLDSLVTSNSYTY